MANLVRWQVSKTAAETESDTCAVKDQGHGRTESPRDTHWLTQDVRIVRAGARNIMLTGARLTPIPQLMDIGGTEAGTGLSWLLAQLALATSSKDERSAFEHERTTGRPHGCYPAKLGLSSLAKDTRRGRNAQSIGAVGKNLLGRIEQRWVVCPETQFHAGHKSTITCHGNDLLEETTRQGLCKFEASLGAPSRPKGWRHRARQRYQLRGNDHRGDVVQTSFRIDKNRHHRNFVRT